MSLKTKIKNNSLQNLLKLSVIIKKSTLSNLKFYLFYFLINQRYLNYFFDFNFFKLNWLSSNHLKKTRVYHLLKSPHVHKKSQEKFLFTEHSVMNCLILNKKIILNKNMYDFLLKKVFFYFLINLGVKELLVKEKKIIFLFI